MVGGVGCSSRAAGYVDVGTMHTIHGRALAFATGIKMARPEFTVVVLTGDGDGAAIGGNHLIHACRRNIDLTCILFNNQVYGMTGGQLSPTMAWGDRATTAPYGQVEQPFDLCRLARGGGGDLRGPGHGGRHQALEELDQARASSTRASPSSRPWCPARWSTASETSAGGVLAMLDDEKARSVSVAEAARLASEELEGKIVTGVLHHDPGGRSSSDRTRPSSTGRKPRRRSRRADRRQMSGQARGQGSDRAAGRSDLEELGPCRSGFTPAGSTARAAGPLRRAPAFWRRATSSRCASAGREPRGSSSWVWCWRWRPPGTTATWRRRRPTVWGARGGYGHSDVIISDHPIDYPEIAGAPTFSSSCPRTRPTGTLDLLRPDSILIYESENVTGPPSFAGTSFGIPFARLATGGDRTEETTGRRAGAGRGGGDHRRGVGASRCGKR